MQTVNRSMVNIVGALERSLAGNNLEKMAEVRPKESLVCMACIHQLPRWDVC